MDTLRLAVVSTPRSGNSWLKHMLAQVLELDHLAAHLPDEVNWKTLPSRAILQLHWLPDEAFISLLEQYEFRVVVLSRHPLDVLISILAFSQHDSSTLRWLGGAAGNERCIAGASPMSEAFLAYATGPRAKALLGVSVEWWQARDVCRVRYEDLVRDTAGQLAGSLATLGASARKPLSEVAAKATPEEMRVLSVDMLYHVWQAQPGLWKRFLTAPEARRICEAHQDVLKILGYTCDPDESLTSAEAQLTWERFDAAALKRNLFGVKRALREAEARHYQDLDRQRADVDIVARQLVELKRQRGADFETVARQRADLERQRVDLEQQRVDLERQRAELESLARQFADLPMQQIRELAGLGPWSFGAARKLQYWSGRFPRFAGGVKSLVLFWRWTRSRLGELTWGK
ncbi:MAG: sulfotransferase domain-containing protein [Planctomycetia bacterium]|nr:sulfotransferase domain-containing protein [Planctomycetia bacterium]